ncbi:MAG: site-2 protease family protein [Firmicutes bacterium]|nr:site-2 protease family protein [Candidatus Colimorpha enterica]
MLLDLIRSGDDFKEVLIMLLLQIPIILFSLSFHEAAHALIADKMGDHTARNLGRITLNPLKHFDPIGSLCMLLVGIGWAKPVPINARNFDNPKKGMALSGLAGPVANLILGFIGELGCCITNSVYIHFFASAGASAYTLIEIVYNFFFLLSYMNIYLALFNLIPIPPFDGSRIFFSILPDKIYFGVMKYERVIMIVVLILLWTGFIDLPFAWLTDKILDLFDLIIGLVPFL